MDSLKSFAEPSSQAAVQGDPFLLLPPTDPRRGAVERVLASSVFQRSPRASELLLYLFRQVLLRPTESISEQDIAVDVYGRRPGYNASEDAIARVQVSQLRKKLHLYSVDEGAKDPIVIEIPARSYAPTFRERQAESVDVSSPTESLPAASKPIWTFLNGAIIAVLVLGCGVLAYQNLAMKREIRTKFPYAPSLDRLWGTIFHQDRSLQVVLSDSSLMQMADLTGRRVTLSEYRDALFPSRFLSKNVTDPAVLTTAQRVIAHIYTTTQDSDAVWQISRLTLRYGVSANLISARDFRLEPQTSGDVILLGHPYGDPWMELFEGRMNFRYDMASDGKRSILNMNPQPGESRVYESDSYPSQMGYCVIAFQPKPIGTGDALLILGTDMSSTEAGLRAISEEAFAAELLRRIGAGSSGTLPYFEVLARVKLVGGVSPGFEFVTQRTAVH
ncbi:MAG: hypothetical protein PW789_00355 [Edaphobacter sp.]|uniref:hypothetical protein n=1 Tax=Edaphobacter sp. TaxID=1934404 RepID=UPI00239BF7BA|nr:hypothetical protein [Edaphobacter sp.]MDE1175043.1 hypothetical protein [Edaphobacter sp.]